MRRLTAAGVVLLSFPLSVHCEHQRRHNALVMDGVWAVAARTPPAEVSPALVPEAAALLRRGRPPADARQGLLVVSKVLQGGRGWRAAGGDAGADEAGLASAVVALATDDPGEETVRAEALRVGRALLAGMLLQQPPGGAAAAVPALLLDMLRAPHEACRRTAAEVVAAALLADGNENSSGGDGRCSMSIPGKPQQRQLREEMFRAGVMGELVAQWARGGSGGGGGAPAADAVLAVLSSCSAEAVDPSAASMACVQAAVDAGIVSALLTALRSPSLPEVDRGVLAVAWLVRGASVAQARTLLLGDADAGATAVVPALCSALGGRVYPHATVTTALESLCAAHDPTRAAALLDDVLLPQVLLCCCGGQDENEETWRVRCGACMLLARFAHHAGGAGRERLIRRHGVIAALAECAAATVPDDAPSPSAAMRLRLRLRQRVAYALRAVLSDPSVPVECVREALPTLLSLATDSADNDAEVRTGALYAIADVLDAADAGAAADGVTSTSRLGAALEAGLEEVVLACLEQKPAPDSVVGGALELVLHMGGTPCLDYSRLVPALCDARERGGVFIRTLADRVVQRFEDDASFRRFLEEE